MTLPVALSITQGPPALDAHGLADAFPFYLHLDAALCVLGAGPALLKACPGVQVGRALGECFVCEPALLPYEPATPALGKLRLVARQRVPLQLVGGLHRAIDGSILLLLSADFHSVQEMAALGLGLDALPPHDCSAELMLVRRSGVLQQQALQAELVQWRQRAEQLSNILALADGGVLYFDAGGVLCHCNQAIECILEMPGAELLGLPLVQIDAVLQSSIVGMEPAPCVLQPLRDELLRQRNATHRQAGGHGAWMAVERPALTVQLALPARKFVRISVGGAAEGDMVFYVEDITREVEVDRMKSEFLAKAAHGLRTPALSLLANSERLLTEACSADQQRDALDTVHRQAGLLAGLVNELLDLSSLEARRGQDFVLRSCALLPVLQQAAATLLIPDERRKVRLGFERDASGLARHQLAESLVLVDPQKLGLALSHVLSNAFKYSPGGGDVQLWLRGADLDGIPAVAIDVVDQGMGMSREQLAHLFERFWRADPLGAIPGTGLGMPLVKEIMAVLGGRVDVDSLPGRGTRVSLTLPLMSEAQPQAEGPAERPLFSPA